MPDETLKELEIKREMLNKEAEQHRVTRDQLNNEAKKWITERNELNEKLKQLLTNANEYKKRRDEYNEEVKKIKNEKNRLYQLALQYEEDLISKKESKYPQYGQKIWKLKKELKELEFKQMTSVLTKEKEKELIESISKIQIAIKEAENSIYKDNEINELNKLLKETKEKLDEINKKVKEMVNTGQEFHDKMLKEYELVDAVREQIDHANEEFIKVKLKADEEHRLHIQCITNIRDLDKMIKATKSKEKKEEKISQSTDEILERLMKGEKISTEDIYSVQKATKN
jgi:uncharacterized coiled-coil DUF342 family protein